MAGKKNDRQVWNALVLVLQFGINMIVPIVLCVLLGIWVGDKTGAKWATIVLFFVGALAGVTNIYKIVRKMIRDAKNDDRLSPSAHMESLEKEKRKSDA